MTYTMVTEGKFEGVDLAYVCADNNGSVIRVCPPDGVLVLPEFQVVSQPTISRAFWRPELVEKAKLLADTQIRRVMREACEACAEAYEREVGHPPARVVLLDKGRVVKEIVPDHEWEHSHTFGAAAF